MVKKQTSKRWSTTEAQRLLAELDRSGLSDRAFAKKKGFDPQRLWWWRKRLKQPRRSEELTFVEVKPKTPTSEVVASEAVLEVRLLNGRVVMVSSQIEPMVLVRLLDVIEGRSC